jgi:hypothetical protein
MAKATDGWVRRSSDHYRQEAVRCRGLAENAASPVTRASLGGVAASYEDMARLVEALEKSGQRW